MIYRLSKSFTFAVMLFLASPVYGDEILSKGQGTEPNSLEHSQKIDHGEAGVAPEPSSSSSEVVHYKGDVGPEGDKIIREAIDTLHSGDYLGALHTFKKLIDLMPNHPAGYTYYAGTLQWIMFDFRNFQYEKEFLEVIDKAFNLAKKMVDENPNDPWSYFYLGAAYGFRGIYYTNFGNIFQMLGDGIRGYSNLVKANEIKPDIYDTYFGIGMFHYWRGHYLKGFFGKQRQMGIEELKLAVEKGNYSNMEAKSSLVRIYFNEGNYQEGISLTQEILKETPNYLYIRWYQCSGYELLEDWENVVKSYTWLRDYFLKSKLSSNTALIEVNYHIANGYYKMKNYPKALEYVNYVLKDDTVLDETKEKVKSIKGLKKDAVRLERAIVEAIKEGSSQKALK